LKRIVIFANAVNGLISSFSESFIKQKMFISHPASKKTKKRKYCSTSIAKRPVREMGIPESFLAFYAMPHLTFLRPDRVSVSRRRTSAAVPQHPDVGPHRTFVCFLDFVCLEFVCLHHFCGAFFWISDSVKETAGEWRSSQL
jgi:hypothetical protein